MAESFPMTGGDGTYSYTKNSQLQKHASDFAKEMIKETIIEKLDTKTLKSNSTTFRIVDFGCSVGPNTFFAMENVIEAVKNKCSFESLDTKDIEFQVFFNDHSENDFNILFASLPVDRQYYASATPGSFYGRLFPRGSINLAYSSFALHWLSKVPDEVCDRKSTAWNEGRIHYTGSPREVVDEYANQFNKDMGVFMSARAQEIVGGGLMVLLMPGIRDEARNLPHSACVMFDFIGSNLVELANEGFVDIAAIDKFNLPIYVPTVEEIRKVIDKNGYFSIERIDVANPRVQLLNGSMFIMHVRAGFEGILTKHFGREVMEEIFIKTSAKSDEISEFLNSGNPNSTQVFMVLKRK